jgi:hypothetical protein
MKAMLGRDADGLGHDWRGNDLERECDSEGV